LKKTVKKNSIVVDIGSGLGFISFAASRLGAKKCILYEVDTSVAQLSKIIAKQNRIQNCQILSMHTAEIKVPPKADIVVSETLGSFAYEENIIENMETAKEFIRNQEGKLEGTLIPGKLKQFIAPVSGNQTFELVNTWDKIGFDLDFSLARKRSVSNMFQQSVSPTEIWKGKESTMVWDNLNFYEKNSSIRRSRNLLWKIDSNMKLHGFCLWWEAELVPGVVLSTSPFEPKTHWEQVFIPVEEPVSCQVGDLVLIQLVSESSYDFGIDVEWQILVKRGEKMIYEFDNGETEDLDEINE